MIEKEDFENLNQKRATGFNKFFVWAVSIETPEFESYCEPVGNLEDIVRVNTRKSPMTENSNWRMFGTDILMKQISGGFRILFGYFNKTSGKDFKKAEHFLSTIGIHPVRIRSETLYSIGMSRGKYHKYLLREYRAGAERFQAYFKDDHYKPEHRLIEERLETDWFEGIRPYQLVLHRPNANEILINGNGIVLFSKFEDGLKVANEIIEKALEDRRKIDHKVEHVGMSVIPNLPIRIVERNPLYISITSKEQDKESLANKMMKHLSASFSSYGGTREDGAYHFILQREVIDNESNFIASSFTLNIYNDLVIVNPASDSSLVDIIEIFYGIERFFRVSTNWLEN